VCDDVTTTVTITGSNFPPNAIVKMDNTPLEVTEANLTEITATVPGLMPVKVYSLTVTGEGPCEDSSESTGVQAITPGIVCWYTDTLSSAITVLHRAVDVTSFEPTWGMNTEPVVVTITGSDFQPDTEVWLGDNYSLTVTYGSQERLVATITDEIEPGSYDLCVVNPSPCECEDCADTKFEMLDDLSVIITNVAYLCIEDAGCVPSNPVINTPYEIYLPLVTKLYSAP